MNSSHKRENGPGPWCGRDRLPPEMVVVVVVAVVVGVVDVVVVVIVL